MATLYGSLGVSTQPLGGCTGHSVCVACIAYDARAMAASNAQPIIGITADASAEKFLVSRAYVAMVQQAGGVAVVLPCVSEHAGEYVRLCDGIMLTGGDDPIMTRWNQPQHPKAKPIDAQRQEFELALLDALVASKAKPALGICLGMQLMGLHAGGALNQHLPDTLPTAKLHGEKSLHEVSGELGSGMVLSHHRQALTDAGCMRTVATAPDGVIEAIQRDGHAFFLGVQWHPERTQDANLGLAVIRNFVGAAAHSMRT